MSPERIAVGFEDLLFSSVFSKEKIVDRVLRRVQREFGRQPNQRYEFKHAFQKRVWYTGENQRPPNGGYDLSFSFETDSLGGTNIYLPLYYLALDWFEDGQIQLGLEARRSGKVVKPLTTTTGRQSNVSERPKFLCAFVGNPEPIRMRAIKALERIGVVDVYGQAVGRPVPNKFEVAQNYRFMLCFENDLYPGYVTEKPLEAWVTGCIPLWRGLDRNGCLNPLSHLNAASFDSLEEFVNRVENLNNNVMELTAMGREPLFSGQLTIDPAREALRRLFN
jgi:hypothetical protein